MMDFRKNLAKTCWMTFARFLATLTFPNCDSLRWRHGAHHTTTTKTIIDHTMVNRKRGRGPLMVAFFLCIGVFSVTVELLLMDNEPSPESASPATINIIHHLPTANNERISTQQGHKRILVLHVGPHKTATSSIQASLYHNPTVLAQDSYMFLGKYDDDPHHIPFRRLLVQFRDHKKDKPFFRVFQQHLSQVPPNVNVIVSAEEFSFMGNSTNDQGVPFFALLKQTLQDWNVHVIVGYRRHYEWIVSFYNEKHKHWNFGESLVEWYASPTNHVYRFQNDCLAVYTTMKRHFDHVSILNVHDGNPLTSFYCNLVPKAMHTCAWYKHSQTRRKDESIHSHLAHGARCGRQTTLWNDNYQTNSGAVCQPAQLYISTNMFIPNGSK